MDNNIKLNRTIRERWNKIWTDEDLVSSWFVYARVQIILLIKIILCILICSIINGDLSLATIPSVVESSD